MPAFHHYNFMLNAAQNYFSQMNPIAAKIAHDVNDTKCAYGELWHTLKPSEQENIIDETLIKPEIALKYYDRISMSTSISTSNSATLCSNSKNNEDNGSNMSNSLAAVVLKNIDNVAFDNSNIDEDKNERVMQAKQSPYSMEYSQCYAYDKKNLSTYALQKVANKIVQDDSMRTYRDEHSAPFSYRTKSQINLANCYDSTETTKTDNNYKCTVPQQISNPKLLQDHFETFVHNQHRVSAPYPSTPASDNCPQQISHKKSTVEWKSPPTLSLSVKCVQNYYNSAPLQQTDNMNYAVLTDEFLSNEENVNLMQNFGTGSYLGSGGCGSSSSAATTDDEDDKTLCQENVKLLVSDAEIRKGFDFLNNW